jgi:hypothetical protein
VHRARKEVEKIIAGFRQPLIHHIHHINMQR